MDPDEVETTEFEYSDRGPGDWVSSGPLGDGAGPGRRFESVAAAELWARRFYGARFRRMLTDTIPYGRWGCLVQATEG